MLYLYHVNTCVSAEMCISQSAHEFVHPNCLALFFAGAYSVTLSHTPLCLTPGPRLHTYSKSCYFLLFSEEFHLAIRSPEQGLDELEGSGRSNSKFIFNNGGNYSHPEFLWISN